MTPNKNDDQAVLSSIGENALQSSLPELQLLETGVCLRARALWSGDAMRGFPVLIQSFELTFMYVHMDDLSVEAEITTITKKLSMRPFGEVGNEIVTTVLENDTAVRAFIFNESQRLELPSELPNVHGPIAVVSVSEEHPGIFLLDTMNRPTGVSIWVIKTLNEALTELRDQIRDAEETGNMNEKRTCELLLHEMSYFIDLTLEFWARLDPPPFGK